MVEKGHFFMNPRDFFDKYCEFYDFAQSLANDDESTWGGEIIEASGFD